MAEEETKNTNEAPAAEAEKVETAAAAPAEETPKEAAPAEAAAPSAADKPAEASAPAQEAPKAEGRNDRRGPGGRPNNRRGPKPAAPRREDDGIMEKVLFINRCAKVVKGGRRFSFSALVVVGDGAGKVGIGFGKANEVAECIRKANEAGRREMESVNLVKDTIPHEIIGEFGGSRVLMRPAAPGTGLIAGGGVRAVAEAAGVKDLLAKSLGSSNPSNVAKAALEGLRQLTLKEEILQARGK
ncbi:MAG: 30S ribosomal protein S5 [Verrucomicrobiota bacterium]